MYQPIYLLAKGRHMPRIALSNISIATLRKEIDRRLAKLDALKAHRDALDKQIAELEGHAAEAPRKPSRKPGRKPQRKPGRKPKARRAAGKPLAEYVKEALAKAPNGLSVKEIEKAVLAAGYPTAAKTIYNPIMKVLAKGGFKKLDRGIYGLKGAAKAGRKAGKKAAKKASVAAPKAKAPAKKTRKTFAQTGDQMILALLAGGKALTTAEINEAWKRLGRGGVADKTLGKLVKDGKLKREKVEGARGSRYSTV